METTKKFVFDFDSTLTSVEALDVLAEITLKDDPKKDEIIDEIKEITNLGIDGDISFTESLERRIKLIQPSKEDIKELIVQLEGKVSKSIEQNRAFFENYADDIYVISCGFKEFIDDIVLAYNIPSERVFANTFVFDANNKVIGFDDQNVLAQHNGKIDCLKQLDLEGEVHVIGDGYSDYVMRGAGVADKFFAYTENVAREKAVKNADHVVETFDEFLYVNDLPRNQSFPKSKIKILLLENVHSDAFDRLSEDGFKVEILAHSLSEDELIEKIKGVHVLGIRSKTKVTQKVIEAADKLMAIGTFCIGTKQVNLDACAENGIVVFNAPYSNTRSVVELAIGEIIMLMRNIFTRSMELHQGQWNKTAINSKEIRGKKLGIVGYGNIGKQLSILAEAMGMEVHYFDVMDKLALGNARRCHSLEELLKISDVVSLHIDDNAINNNFIGAREISWMKDGAILLNLARGFVVELEALTTALKSGKLGGCAVDVYPEEPRANGDFITELKGLENVILTPHIGGSTEEAQKDIAEFVPNKIMSYINSGTTVDAVNFPNVRLPEMQGSHRFLHLHNNVPGIMAKLNVVFAKYELNIVGQYLSTDERLGYVITDIGKDYDKGVIKALKEIEGTLKFRVLY
ncbi:phosphoglycerate dehydrogenase [Flavobacteriaceae bacterium]|nr:phosphoglycerate dehydrogenase [Flavobacteriaceae bacterium]